MRITTAILLLIIPFALFAQQGGSRSELEKRRQSILESIRETQDQLEATKKDKKATLSQLRALQAKLDARQRLIGNINEEILDIDNNIKTSSQEVTHLQGNLEQLKARYAQSLRYAYRNRNSYSMLAFLFSSSDFNEAVRRLKYLKKYRDYRKEQADQIRLTQGQIKEKIGVLSTQKNQKGVLLSAEEQQKQVLQKETDQTNQVAKELKGREKELATQIQKDQKAAREVDRAINRIIQREIELARKKAEEEQRKRLEEQRRQEEQKRAAALAASKANANNNSGVKLNTGTGMRGESEKPAGGTTTGSSTVASSAGTRTATPRIAKPKEDLSYKMSLTPEATALANGFESNRGRLPWPVEKGFIASHFGVHPHPVETKVMMDNAGVTIATGAGATARAVFDGTVTSVFSVPGAGKCIMISHGTYFTVYTGLASVSVSKDQSVHTKQVIGTVGQNDEGENVIDFQVWKIGGNNKFFKMDPEGWIAR
ncbi:peptidoglycan DD-metalloendopeptidase family protein [Chitinophagaceae bacterium MMS25-I14]